MDIQQYKQLSAELDALCYKGAFEEAKQIAITHYEQALDTQNDYIELQMLRYMMMSSAHLGQYEILLHFFERYESLCHALKDEQCLLFFNIYLMYIYNHQGFYEQSMYVLKRACRMALEKKNKLATLEAFSNACATATLLKQYDHAIQYALIGMTHVDDDMHRSIFAVRLEMNLAIALIYNDQLALAKTYIERNRFLIEDDTYARFLTDHAQYYRAKALIAEHEQHYIGAKVYLKQALTLLLRQGNVTDLVHLIRANIHLAKLLHDDLYFQHASHMLQSFINSATQRRMDDIALLNIQRHVARDQRATQTFDEQIGVHRAKGIFQIVNEWLESKVQVDCAVITVGSLTEKDDAYLSFIQKVNKAFTSANVIVGFNAQQLLIFWHNADDEQIEQQLALVEQHAPGLAVIGRSTSTTETIHAKELYNFAYAQLYYMRELDMQTMAPNKTKQY